MKFNLLSTEVAKKYGPDSVYCKDWLRDEDNNTPQCVRDYVFVPFPMVYTPKERAMIEKRMGIKVYPGGDPIEGCLVKMDILRDRLLKAHSRGEFTTNARAMVEKWSRDGEHVYLFSGIAKDQPYMSWSCQLGVAYQFATVQACINLEGHKDDEMEVRVMKVPLDKIDAFTYWAVHQAGEVLVDTSHPVFKELYAESYGLTPDEAREMDAMYFDKRYDFDFSFPKPLLRDWNRYPYNLIYPPTGIYAEEHIGEKWCMDTLSYVKT